MPDAPSVSILVPTRDRAGMLRECLAGLLGQTRAPLQVLVVDDGSTDSTPDVLDEFRGSIESLRGSGSGKSSAVNAALPRVRGELLWIFDDDDVAFPDAIERIGAAFGGAPRAGIGAGSYQTECENPTTGEWEALRTVDPPDFESLGLLPLLLEGNHLTGAALVSRTDAIREVGGLDPALLRSQDYDLALRLATGNEAVRIPGGPTYRFRQHGGVRGSPENPIQADKRRRTWLEYDQRIFEALHKRLAPEDYLKKGSNSANRSRAGIFRRAFVMARRNLWSLVQADLETACGLVDPPHLEEEESRTLWAMAVDSPYYGCGGFADHPRVAAQVVGGLRGPLARPIRRTLSRAITRDLASQLRRGQVRRVARLRTALITWT
jgi:hypothetical protein